MRRGLLLIALVLSSSSLASAQATLPLTEVPGGQITVDGLLREWTSTMTAVGTGDDASMRFALAYDGDGVFVAAEVHDDRMVRTAHPGDDEDAVVLTLALPRGRSLSGTDVWIYAGVAGTSAAVVSTGTVGASRRSSPRGAQVVEAPLARGSGYTIEAFVPWSAIPGAHTELDDARGSIRLHDVDQAAHPTVEAEPSLCPVDRAHLDQLLPLAPTNGEMERLRGFLDPRGLSAARPTHEWHVDVAEDATPEHVMIIDRFVVVIGPAYEGGTGYGFAELGIPAAADLVRVEAPQDLTGDGKAELCVVLRQHSAEGSRDLFEVLSLSTASIASIFDVEIRKQTSVGSVDGTARIERGRGRGALPSIVTGAGTAHGLDASTLHESPPTDVHPMIYPWGPVLERTFRWDGHQFAQISERPNPHYVDPATLASSSSSTTPAPEPEPVGPSMDDVLAAYRREAGIGARVRPSFDRTGNLAGSPAAERALVFGRELVVIGPEFRDGTGWFRYQLPCEAADLLDFQVADLTGEGRSELLFRIRQTIGDVRREVLLIHMFTPTDFPAVLQREVAREREGNRIENQIVTTGGHLEIRPGTARGWTQESWPFSDAAPTDGVEPPLLPWRDHALTFHFDHGHMVSR